MMKKHLFNGVYIYHRRINIVTICTADFFLLFGTLVIFGLNSNARQYDDNDINSTLYCRLRYQITNL